MDEWTRLALSARAGDPADLAAFVRLAQPDVWRLCAHLGDREHADDLTQETFLRVFAAWGSFRGDGSIRAWIFRIVRRVVAEDIAGRQRRRRQHDALSAQPGEPVGPDAQQQLELSLLVAALTEERRAAFWLTQVVGFSYADAAAFCDCPVGTIRSRVARAREDLVAMIGTDERGRADAG